MAVIHVQHPLIEHRLLTLRDKETPNELFRSTLEKIAFLIGVEATRSLHTLPATVETPVAQARGHKLTSPEPIIIPILRAGLAVSEPLIELIPNAELGLIGIKRDEETAEPHVYLDRIPHNLENRTAFVVDPMLATAGSLDLAISHVKKRNARDIRAICIVAAPEGIERIEAAHPDVDVYVGAIDEKLNEQFYIVPGVGDAGDRLFGPNV